MIAEIRLRDFKRFRDLSLRTAALTVLTGTNGAGKTSVLHSLLLARQMTRRPQQNYVELNGVDTLELGGPEDVIHREASKDLAAIEVLDAEDKRWRWSFQVPTDEKQTLNAEVVDRPVDYKGAIVESAPAFTYLCAERLGPRDVLSASAADVGELGVGARGEFVAQVLASSGRMRVREGRLAGDATDTKPSDLLHQTERWMGRIVRSTEIDVEWFLNTSVTRLRFKTPGLRSEWTRAPNAGFGISYALPVLVARQIAAPCGSDLLPLRGTIGKRRPCSCGSVQGPLLPAELRGLSTRVPATAAQHWRVAQKPRRTAASGASSVSGTLSDRSRRNCSPGREPQRRQASWAGIWAGGGCNGPVERYNLPGAASRQCSGTPVCDHALGRPPKTARPRTGRVRRALNYVESCDSRIFRPTPPSAACCPTLSSPSSACSGSAPRRSS